MIIDLKVVSIGLAILTFLTLWTISFYLLGVNSERRNNNAIIEGEMLEMTNPPITASHGFPAPPIQSIPDYDIANPQPPTPQ